MNYLTSIERMGRLKMLILFCGGLAGVVPVYPELFDAHELTGNGWGESNPPVADYSYQRCHERIETADINGDGFPDLVVLSDTSDAGSPTDTPPVNLNPDLGNAGDPYGNLFKGSDLFWYQNDGYGNFFPRPVTVDVAGDETSPTIANGKCLAVSDLDGDGDIDIAVWTHYWHNQAAEYAAGAGRAVWFENRRSEGETWDGVRPKFLQHNVVATSGGFEKFTVGAQTYNATIPRFGDLFDMDGDGRKDFIVLCMNGAVGTESKLFWFRNTGNPGAGLFPQTVGNVFPIVMETTSLPFQESDQVDVVASDVDNDGRVDLVMGEWTTDQDLTVLHQEPSGKFSKQIVASPFYVQRSLAVKDILGNACKEIIAGALNDPPSSHSPVTVFSADNAGCNNWTPTVLPEPVCPMGKPFGVVWDIRIEDLNNDAKPDILAYQVSDPDPFPNGKYSVVSFWVNSGNNPAVWPQYFMYENNPLPDPPDNGGGLAVADFDNDGDKDVVRAQKERNLVYFENNWNTERSVLITATAQKNGIRQKVTSILSTSPNKSVGRPVGQKVENQ